MSSQQTLIRTHSVDTPSGRISYTEAGSGPVALFVHGVVLNKHVWRRQLTGLSDTRRCIAVDLLAHGDTEIDANQDVSVSANANMLREALDALKIDKVDLVGNDSGGGIAQIFAAMKPNRVRSLTLTNCDTHDNWPPEAFKPFVEMAIGGGLRDTINAMLADKAIYRSPAALGPAYERPENVSDEDIEIYLRPHVRTEQRTRDLQRFGSSKAPGFIASTDKSGGSVRSAIQQSRSASTCSSTRGRTYSLNTVRMQPKQLKKLLRGLRPTRLQARPASSSPA